MPWLVPNKQDQELCLSRYSSVCAVKGSVHAYLSFNPPYLSMHGASPLCVYVYVSPQSTRARSVTGHFTDVMARMMANGGWDGSHLSVSHAGWLGECVHFSTNWGGRGHAMPTEAHSLVAVRIIPVVKIILELKFIFLPQNGLQEQLKLKNNFNCKSTVNLAVHWQSILIAKYQP